MKLRRLTTRDRNKLTPTRTQAMITAAILRQLHAVVTMLADSHGQSRTFTDSSGRLDEA